MWTIRVIGCGTSDIYASHPCNVEQAVEEVAERVMQAGYKTINAPYCKAASLSELAEQCYWMRWRFECKYEECVSG